MKPAESTAGVGVGAAFEDKEAGGFGGLRGEGPGDLDLGGVDHGGQEVWADGVGAAGEDEVGPAGLDEFGGLGDGGESGLRSAAEGEVGSVDFEAAGEGSGGVVADGLREVQGGDEAG